MRLPDGYSDYLEYSRLASLSIQRALNLIWGLDIELQTLELPERRRIVHSFRYPGELLSSLRELGRSLYPKGSAIQSYFKSSGPLAPESYSVSDLVWDQEREGELRLRLLDGYDPPTLEVRYRVEPQVSRTVVLNLHLLFTRDWESYYRQIRTERGSKSSTGADQLENYQYRPLPPDYEKRLRELGELEAVLLENLLEDRWERARMAGPFSYANRFAKLILPVGVGVRSYTQDTEYELAVLFSINVSDLRR